MGERTSHPAGSFCWADLVTEDPAAARAFYGQVLGWQFEDLPGTEYTVALVGGRAAAAIGPNHQPGAPPHFNCYVSVDDADATAARAAELGATVLLEPGDVGASGRLAVLADPQGAAFSLWQPGEHPGARVVNEPGALTWNDLATTDVDEAERFYGELFGWTLEAASDDPPYEVIHLADGRNNGGMVLAAEGQPPVWVAYFAVADVAATVARAQEGGGAVIAGPDDVPAGTFAVLCDPQGAVFSVFSGTVFDD